MLLGLILYSRLSARTQNGQTALMCAAENAHADCVRLLLDAGADVNARDRVPCGCLRMISMRNSGLVSADFNQL